MSHTDATFLFANPSLLYGVAYLYDFEGNFTSYNVSANGEEADAIAVYRDWLAVGQTLCDAANEFSAETR